MIRLSVRVVTGHYRVPGTVAVGAVARSFPIAPPSTIVGFLESLIGVERGAGVGRFAYGWEQPPGGQGAILRVDHVWSSSGTKGRARGAKAEATRPVRHETFVDLAYQIAAEGPWEQQLEAAIDVGAPRFGVLSLGESDDAVWWLHRVDRPAQWVVPGDQMLLIRRSGQGYDRVNPLWAKFALTEMADNVPREAWMEAPQEVRAVR